MTTTLLYTRQVTQDSTLQTCLYLCCDLLSMEASELCGGCYRC